MTDNSDELNRASRDIWDRIADFWDQTMGAAGNDSHRLMIAPAAVRLLDPRPGQAVLDCACGNGVFARRLAALGVRVTGFDFSEEMIRRAREHAARAAHAADMAFHVMDATDEAQLMTLGEGRFDALACLMALMDMPVVEPLFRAARRLLKPGGRFVFGVVHPCFNSAPGTAHLAETEDRDGEMTTVFSVKVAHYLTPATHRGLGVVGQPAAQYYFHRPLHALLGPAFEAGFVLDGLDEPRQPAREAKSQFSWANYPEIPPFLLARLRPK